MTCHRKQWRYVTGDQLPSVDIVIAARNEEESLPETLSALARQDYPRSLLRIYVVDNGSSDNTSEVAVTAGASLLKLDTGKDGAARNLGIRSGPAAFLGFLDAHCVPGRTWVSEMISNFDHSHIGACFGPYEHKYKYPVVEKLEQVDGTASDLAFLENTLCGMSYIFPWVPSGNSIFRRSAVERAGLFNEELSYCEDLELSFRLFLLGYQFRYVPAARVVHCNNDSLLAYWKKHMLRGSSDFRVEAAYRFGSMRRVTDLNAGDREAGSRQSPPTAGSFERLALKCKDLAWKGGYLIEQFRCWCGLAKMPAAHDYRAVAEEFRPAFLWDGGSRIRISQDVLFWFAESDLAIVINIARSCRFLLKDSAAFVFRKLTESACRGAVIQGLSQAYTVTWQRAECDVDAFLTDLLEEKIIIAVASFSS